MPTTKVEAIRTHIAESRQPEAIALLLPEWLGRDERLHNLTLQLKERYNALQTQIARGVISQPDAELERAKITDGLLFLTDRLTNPQSEIPRHLQDFLHTAPIQKRTTAQWIIPGVISILILALGFFAIKNFTAPTTFDLKIALKDTPGMANALAHQKVNLFFGNNFHDSKELDSEGNAIFANISNKFSTDSVKLALESPAYRIVRQSAPTFAKSDQGSIIFEIEPVTQYTNWRGKVTDAKGNPIANATLEIDSGIEKGETDEQGNFAIKVPKASGEQIQLTIYHQGRTVFTSSGFTISESQPSQITVL